MITPRIPIIDNHRISEFHLWTKKMTHGLWSFKQTNKQNAISICFSFYSFFFFLFLLISVSTVAYCVFVNFVCTDSPLPFNVCFLYVFFFSPSKCAFPTNTRRFEFSQPKSILIFRWANSFYFFIQKTHVNQKSDLSGFWCCFFLPKKNGEKVQLNNAQSLPKNIHCSLFTFSSDISFFLFFTVFFCFTKGFAITDSVCLDDEYF